MEKAFFITGMARSGTTLLERMLDQHPEIAVSPETNFFQILDRLQATKQFTKAWQYPAFIWQISQWLHNYNDPAFTVLQTYYQQHPTYLGDTQTLLQNLATSYLEAKGKRIFAEKHPNHIYYQKVIYNICPQAKLIYMLRHPLDIVCSTAKLLLLAQNKSNEELTNRLLLQSALFVKRGARAIFQEKGFPETKKHYLKLEDLLAQPEEKLQAVCDFLKIPYDKNMLAPETQNYVNPEKSAMNKVHQKLQHGIDSKHVYVYKEKLNAKQKALLSRFLKKEVLQMGYTATSEKSVLGLAEHLLLIQYSLIDRMRPYAWKEAYLQLKSFSKRLLLP